MPGLPFADCACYHFTVTSHNCEYTYLLSPVSSPSKLLNLRKVSGTLNAWVEREKHVSALIALLILWRR